MRPYYTKKSIRVDKCHRIGQTTCSLSACADIPMRLSFPANSPAQKEKRKHTCYE